MFYSIFHPAQLAGCGLIIHDLALLLEESVLIEQLLDSVFPQEQLILPESHFIGLVVFCVLVPDTLGVVLRELLERRDEVFLGKFVPRKFLQP